MKLADPGQLAELRQLAPDGRTAGWPALTEPFPSGGLSLLEALSGYLGPGPHPPLGGAGVAVAAAPGLRAAVVAVLAVDGARGVVVRRLHAAHRAHLLPRLAAGLAAVLPLPGHPAAERRDERVQPDL